VPVRWRFGLNAGKTGDGGKGWARLAGTSRRQSASRIGGIGDNVINARLNYSCASLYAALSARVILYGSALLIKRYSSKLPSSVLTQSFSNNNRIWRLETQTPRIKNGGHSTGYLLQQTANFLIVSAQPRIVQLHAQSGIMRGVKEKDVVQKDRIRGTKYLKKEFKAKVQNEKL
jgi:hypothetical protein